MDFYTEVQDLSYLENSLSSSLPPRFAALNMAMISLVEDFSLVGFETLAVEVPNPPLPLNQSHSPPASQDKNSMINLTRVIDRATGYIYVPPPSSKAPPGTTNDTAAPPSVRANTYALFSSAAGEMKGLRSDVRDVQERWLDAKEEWDAFERREWSKEGEAVARERVGASNGIRERKGGDVGMGV